MKKVIMICLLLILNGCAQTYWVHPTKGPEEFEADKYDCYLIAEQSAHDFGASGNPLIINDELKRCLQYKKGWKQTTKPPNQN
jgi:hypothetical protein